MIEQRRIACVAPQRAGWSLIPDDGDVWLKRPSGARPCAAAIAPAKPVQGGLLTGWPLLQVQRGDDAFDLLDVRPFVARQPLPVGQHGPCEHRSCPRHSRRT